jgi:lipid A disaccharide synthetase
MNLLENETNPDKLKTEFEKLFPSAEKRKTILKQYRNLKSLSSTGVVANKLED